MYDIKNKRKFLNRTRQPNLPAQLLIGTKLQIHSRQHCIVDYGDDKTRKVKLFIFQVRMLMLKNRSTLDWMKVAVSPWNLEICNSSVKSFKQL